MRRILVIDDQSDNLIVLSTLLKDLIPDVTVITAQSGITGLEKAKTEAPDTILLDILMPGMDGFEVCRILKSEEETRNIPVIMITAMQTDSQSRIKGFKIGADAFLSKPIDEAELVAQIKVTLRIKQIEDQLRQEKSLLAEKVRKKAEEFYQLVNTSPDGVITMSLEGRFLEANPAFLNMLGCTMVELKDLTLRQITSQNSSETDENIFQDACLGIGTGRSEQELVRKDGTRIPISISGWNLNDEKGNPQKLGAFVRDITGQKMYEKQITSSLREKEILLQEIHHRVKNNMQVISSLLKLQSDKTQDERIKRAISESRNRIYTMAAVHETLYSSDNLSSIDLKTYLTKVSKSLLQTYQSNHDKIQLHIMVEDINLGIRQASPLGLIINELLSNCLKYAFPENRAGEATLKVKKLAGNQLDVTISDNGIGIPSTLDWRNSSTLGLQLVITLVEDQLDGSIQLVSSGGTKFIIKFNFIEG